jgi:hypothetical protein
VIEPGRWGRITMANGSADGYFYREQLLELWRRTQTSVPVSRLLCAFAFEDRATAAAYAEPGERVYEVETIGPESVLFRADALWLTWMGEPNSTFDRMMSQCRAYWRGESTEGVSADARPAWEWLCGGGLQVIGAA